MVIDTDVFGDAIEPRVKGRVATEGINSTKRFEPCFLRQVFGSFGVFHLSENLVVDPGVVFDNKHIKGISFAVLCAFDVDVFFGVCRQDQRRL